MTRTWEPKPPQFLDYVGAIYDLRASDAEWCEAIQRITTAQLPGELCGMVGVGSIADDTITPKAGWATEPAILEYSTRVCLRLPKNYVRQRINNPAATDRQIVGSAVDELPERSATREMGARDTFIVAGVDPDGFTVSRGALVPDFADDRWAPALVESWERVAFHLLAAGQLRRALTEGTSRPEAFFSASTGALLGAEGPAIAERERLRDAVRWLGRSRGRYRDRPEALDAHAPTFDARWTLVDQFDADGKHFIVAYAPDADDPEERHLSPRERRVAEYLALGWSMKRVAYRLGLAPGTVANYASRACKKLGVRGRVGLTIALAAARR